MLGIESLEEELGLAKDEWLKLTKNVFESEFMKRRFMDILTDRLYTAL